MTYKLMQRRVVLLSVGIAWLLIAVRSCHAFTVGPEPTACRVSSSSSVLEVATTVEPVTTETLDSSDAVVQQQQDNDIKVEFPPPLSTVDRIKRAATFWSTALPIVLSYYGLISKLKLQELLQTSVSEQQVQQMWDDQHQAGAVKLAETIADLKGFYVKTAQIISARQDLFPPQYTDALSGFTDNLDPMSTELAKAVVRKELLKPNETFEDVFEEFDDEPLGAASVAQVHRAKLTARYGGREVAVKVQRPSIESKLMGDIANLKAIAKTFRDNPSLPLDYYTVFAELEKQLANEFDFVAEAVAMDRIYHSLIRAPDGSPRELPLVLPRPVDGMVSKRVLVMDFLRGVPLSRAREEMAKRGVDPDSPEAKLFGRKLLTALTTVFGRNILETGFFHAGMFGDGFRLFQFGRRVSLIISFHSYHRSSSWKHFCSG